MHGGNLGNHSQEAVQALARVKWELREEGDRKGVTFGQVRVTFGQAKDVVDVNGGLTNLLGSDVRVVENETLVDLINQDSKVHRLKLLGNHGLGGVGVVKIPHRGRTEIILCGSTFSPLMIFTMVDLPARRQECLFWCFICWCSSGAMVGSSSNDCRTAYRSSNTTSLFTLQDLTEPAKLTKLTKLLSLQGSQGFVTSHLQQQSCSPCWQASLS